MEKPSLNSEEAVLIIFVKNPAPGKVKTRLAKEMGEAEAVSVYKALLAITHQATAPLNCAKKVYYQDDIGKHDLWDEGDFVKCRQSNGGLGEKMEAVFRENLKQFSKTVIIGSDCPDIKPELLEEAFGQLEQHDAVIGPAEDGGYYLLGLKTFEPALFTNKSWSTDRVLEETLETLRERGYTYHLLPVLNDIDTPEDLRKSPLKDQFPQRDGA